MNMTTNLLCVIPFALLGCASSANAEKPITTEAADGANVFIVDANADARQILNAVPAESAMEKFQMTDANGRRIAYVAFTDTQVGGLVFVNGKLLGTVSKHDAQAFYDCRGYVTATTRHWAIDASQWADSLVKATTPTDKVKLYFSGDSTAHSIKEVNKNDTEMLMSLLSFSINPVNILKKLNAARESMREREQYKKTLQSLSAITPGDSEAQLAKTLEPEDVFFGENGLVMAYPNFAFEYYVSAGSVRLAQQPSFYRASRARPALFYAAGMNWAQCTPQGWNTALPEAAIEIKPELPLGGKSNAASL